jgi:serine/threonine-protein kinase
MSRVFLAEETRLGRQVVIKVLPPEMGAAVNVERFEREIQLAARLQHPHIVPLLTAAASGDLLYYVMPFISGESLRAKLAREGALPVPEAVKILREVVDALAYAHAHGVVHRDIKPDNVLLSTGHAVVTDFGVAKAVSISSGGHSSLTSLGVALGTPAYMAPEQAAADPHVDHRADIYAVGTLAYEMLTGRTPFTAPTPQAQLAAHITQTPDPITKHRPAVPAAVNGLLMRCLEKHPADRWQTAAELMAQLEVVLTPSGGMTPSQALPAVSSGTEEALRKSHPVRVVVSFFAAAVVTLGIVFLLVRQFGLPDWVLYGAVVLMGLGLPIILATGYFERKRAVARATGRIIPPAASGVHRLFTWKKAIRGGLLAFAALAVVVAVYTAMRVLGIGPVGTLVASGKLNETDKLLVADFENHTADPSLGPSITEAFRIDLAQTPVVRILTTSQVSDGLRRMQKDATTPVTGDVAREMATREGAKAVVAGEISAIGKSYVVAARILAAADGTELVALRETADNDAGIVAALDRLAGKVRERIGESLKTIRSGEPLEQVTTSSLEALRLYTEGSRLNDNGEAGPAVPLLEQAVALDTGFAMGWRKLAVALGNAGGSPDRIIEATTRAYQHRDRLTEVERQLTIAYYFSTVDWDPPKADAAYRKILAVYPEHFIATNNLALNLLNEGRPAEAESLVVREATTADHPTNVHAQLMLALVAEGRTDSVRAMAASLSRRFPGSSLVHLINVQGLAGIQDLPAAERAAAAYAVEARDSSEQARAAGVFAGVLTTRGRLADGERQAQRFIAIKEGVGLRGAALKTRLELARTAIQLQGDTALGLKLVADALKRYPLDSLARLDRPTATLAMVYAMAGRLTEAHQALARFDSDVPEGVRRGIWEGYNARGWIALRERNSAAALKAFTDGRIARSCPDCSWWEAGLAFEQAGQPDSAIAAYETASATGTAWKSRVDTWALAPSLKRAGELYEERGNKAKALDYYGRFAELWKAADPELQPQVRDVKARMAKLAGEPGQ